MSRKCDGFFRPKPRKWYDERWAAIRQQPPPELRQTLLDVQDARALFLAGTIPSRGGGRHPRAT